MPSPWALPACVCTEGAALKTTSFLRTQIRMRASCVKLRLWTVPVLSSDFGLCRDIDI